MPSAHLHHPSTQIETVSRAAIRPPTRTRAAAQRVRASAQRARAVPGATPQRARAGGVTPTRRRVSTGSVCARCGADMAWEGACLAEEVLRAAGVLPDLDPKGAGDRAQRGAAKVGIDASERRVPQLIAAAARRRLPHACN